MPGSRCAVNVCNNSLIKTRALKNISYHTFPKDPRTFEAWCKACDREDDWNPNTSLICSVHFLDEDFDTNFYANMDGIQLKRRLNRNAIPKLLINASDVKGDFTRRIRKKRSLIELEATVSKNNKKRELFIEERQKKVKKEASFEVETIPHFTFVDINDPFSTEVVISDDEEKNGVEEDTNVSELEGPLTLPKKEPSSRKSALNSKINSEESNEPEYIDFSVLSDLEAKVKKPTKENSTEDEFDIKGKDYAESLRRLVPQQRKLVERLVAEIISQATTNKLKSHVLNLILDK